MKRTVMVVVVSMCSFSNFAQQFTALSEIVSFMSTNDYRRCFMLTNDLDFVMMSTTGIA